MIQSATSRPRHRILMTADTVGGVWTYAIDLCRELCTAGDEVRLVTFGRRASDAQREQVAAIPGLSLRDSVLRLEWMDDPWEDVETSCDLMAEEAQRFEPDIVHLNTFSHSVVPLGAPTVVVGHSCVETWWRAVHGSAPPQEWATYRDRVSQGIQAADAFVAPTAAMLDAFACVYGRHHAARVINNGRDQSLFAATEHRQPFILAAGRLWDEAKNLQTLDEAARRIHWPVRVAGESDSPDGRHGVGARVRPLGQLSQAQLAEQMGRASIYALPARYEPFGLSVLEAAMCGCALVLGDIETLRELWDGAALFVPPDDARVLAAAVNGLAHDDQLRQSLSEAARRRARRYTPQRMAAHYRSLYGELTHTAHHATETSSGTTRHG